MIARTRRAFTLLELLVVVAVIAALISVLLPALGESRRNAQRVSCLANLRSLEIAHWSYIANSYGVMIGTSHGRSWVEVLRAYDERLLLRSPVDTSPHFPGGEPVEGEYRETSYAINYLLSPDNPEGNGKVQHVPSPSRTVHTALLVFEGSRATQDHIHPTSWVSPIIPASEKAATEVQTNAHGGEPGSWSAISNYGYLDGHASTHEFREIYTDETDNRFDPGVAR